MSQTEQHAFKAEIQQLLDIVIHSLYTDKEIFIRELVSNAADALEKLRFLQTTGKTVRDEGLDLKISIQTDDQGKTISFCDTGIGMTRDELIENLGTIARSGSKNFLQQLAENKDKNIDLIGQFGVGFYSAFMAAEEVEVFTRSWNTEHEQGWRWKSQGVGSYEIEEAPALQRGTKIVVRLKHSEGEFSNASRVEEILRRYSSFVQFPIELNGKGVNTVQALWTRSKSDITEEQYKEFYHYVGHDHNDPTYWLHFSADAPLAIKSLIFVPSQSLEKFGMGRHEPEVNLYCRKVLIQAGAKGLFPEWLRFLKGVVDSEDLPLNISRETMQDSALLQKLNKVLTSRFLKFLEEELKTNFEKYNTFFTEFGHCLKEGAVTDFTHREALSKLLLFESSALEKGKRTSFAGYLERAQAEQKEIYYLIAADRAAAEASPYYEAFKAKGLEVLFLLDPRDEFVMDHLGEFEGKKLRAAEKAEISVDAPAGEIKLSDDESRVLANWIKETLGDRVGEVRTSKRLVGSPAVIIEGDPYMTSSLRRVLKAMQQDSKASSIKHDLEINSAHAIMINLNRVRASQPELAKSIAEQIFDNALVSAGLLEDPSTMLKRVNELVERVLKQA